MSKQSGLILLTTILMLALLTLLVLSQMQMVLLYNKTLNHVKEKHQSFYQLEAEANRLALNTWSIQQDCVTNEKNPNEIIKLLKNKQGCVLTEDKQQFFYLIEELGLFPCLQTQLGKVIYSTQHWRINIITTGNYPAFLQLRIARLAKVMTCENSEPTKIKAGLLSWRHLSGKF